MTNHFTSSGGTQPIGQGDHAIGQQNNYYDTISPAVFAEYVSKLAVTESALASFFRILEQEKVPAGDLDSKLREIAGQYKELLARVGGNQAAKQAIDAGDYAKAEALLEDAANQHSLAAAKAHADNARLQRVQLRYAKAAAYWQKAAALLPEDKQKERAEHLSNAGYDLHRIAKYKEALSLWEQSLVIRQEIGDKAGDGATLNNISQIYYAWGDYRTALKYLEQSLTIQQELGDRAGEGITLNNIGQIQHAKGDYPTALKYLEQSLRITQEIGDKKVEGATLNNISQIHYAKRDYATALSLWEQSLVIRQEIGDKAGEGATLNNISQIYKARGDYATALKYLEQNLVLFREIGDKVHEGRTLNNISQIYDARGDYATALKHLEQSLIISQEIGDRRGEAETSWNIGRTYQELGYLRKAEAYISRAVQLAKEIGHPNLKEWRAAFADIRAKLRGK
ncbi:tetratricopeptide repeat protein [Candidatus Electronema sp. PJ]|uniref:tetratricopeptide repeat protein n=1 Tax=Candidatus Electronema sp. PJ TaxID=3401572 RepID=UPI003AA84FA6